MKAFFLVVLSAFFAYAPAHAGFWDAVKKKAKEVSSRAQKTRERKKVRDPKAVNAVRGFGEDRGGKGERGDRPRDYESLQWLESLEVSDDDVDRFVKEGRLAP